MRKALTLLTGILLCLCSQAVTKIVQSNTGTGWNVANNWSPVGVPQSGDEVVIPANKTITIKNNIYSTAANLKIYIHGILDFDPSGKLNLGANSFIQLTSSSSKITTNGSASEQIIIGGGIKYNGSNDGEVMGPAFTSAAAPNSIKGNARRAFTFGVLPVKLASFTAAENKGKINLQWVTTLEENLKHFELQKSRTGRDWKTIVTIPPNNNCACPTSYTYKDIYDETGMNYYRLRSVDIDGSATYSTVIFSKFEGQYKSEVTWQVNNNFLQLQLNSEKWQFPVQIQVIATNGQAIIKKNLVTTSNVLDLHKLPGGVVFLVVEDKTGKRFVGKFLK